ncbi:MAG: TIGR01620 family protein [Pseudomonadota bacterium]
MSDARKPVLMELEQEEGPQTASPATAPPVPDLEAPDAPPPPQGRAMQLAARLSAKRRSPLGMLFWTGLLGLAALAFSTWLYGFVSGLIASSPVLGAVAFALACVFLIALVGYVLVELMALSRLRKVDQIQRRAANALEAQDLADAQGVLGDLGRLYRGRDELTWARTQLSETTGEVLDADALIDAAERTLMAPLDRAARLEIEAATRQVATATALVPLALADVVVALASNVAMIRRIAQVYGGRAGAFGSWRLMRAVATHLLATGAVAVGDDLIGSLAGGGLVSKVSRRFGEGVVNGALTARVGLAAIEVCRPLPYRALKAPSVTSLVTSALGGVFSKPKNLSQG